MCYSNARMLPLTANRVNQQNTKQPQHVGMNKCFVALVSTGYEQMR